MYNLIEEAIHFVFIAFKEKKRRNEDIDLVFHSISVGFMLKDIGCDDNVVIAGILHDVIEDTEYTYDNIEQKFGKYIADLVLEVTEDNSIIDWMERKKNFLHKISLSSNDTCLIEAADKLQNLLSDYEVYTISGVSAIGGSSTYENNKWFYNSMYNLLSERINNKLVNRLKEMINLYY